MKRYDMRVPGFEKDPFTEKFENETGQHLDAEEALAKIRKLEVEIKEARLALHRVRGHLVRKNKALITMRNIINGTFGNNEEES